RPGASRSAMRITPPRLGWVPAWARAESAAASEPRRTAARSRQVKGRARHAMAGSPVLEKDVVIDREKERRGRKVGLFSLGGGGLSIGSLSPSAPGDDLPQYPGSLGRGGQLSLLCDPKGIIFSGLDPLLTCLLL